MPRQRKKKEAEGETSARPFWSGTITFGLVSIPVDLYPANRTSRVSMRMLSPDGQPLQRRYYSEKTGRDLSDEDIVRGYEHKKGKYVIVSDEELERLAPEKTRDIDLKRFVPLKDIPPLHFERGYYLAPSGGSSKAYRLLAESMEASGRAGIATFVMRGKEYLVAILAENGILRAQTMRFADEIRSPEQLGLPDKPKLAAAKVKAFEQAIRRATKRDLPASLLEDEYAERVQKLAAKKKSQGKDVVEIEEAEGATAEVIDLMSVLQKSLKSGGSTGGKKKRAA
ncbi:MAG TPA: Ku protein [Candidatus Limnocylindrales bacterium]|nr:Ku protein [Candidatus Limnocylindrales bacterium]